MEHLALAMQKKKSSGFGGITAQLSPVTRERLCVYTRERVCVCARALEFLQI